MHEPGTGFVTEEWTGVLGTVWGTTGYALLCQSSKELSTFFLAQVQNGLRRGAGDAVQPTVARGDKAKVVGQRGCILSHLNLLCHPMTPLLLSYWAAGMS